MELLITLILIGLTVFMLPYIIAGVMIVIACVGAAGLGIWVVGVALYNKLTGNR